MTRQPKRSAGYPGGKVQSRPRPALSAQMKWVGYLVLAFGLLACASVALLVVSRLGGGDGAGPQTQQAPPPSPSAVAARQQPLSPSQPQQQRRQHKNIRDKGLQGVWQAGFDGVQAVLQIKDGAYSLMLVPDRAGLPRRYSAGGYRLQEDGILTLIPDPQAALPAAAGEEKRDNPHIIYVPLSRSPFGVEVWTAQKSQMRWHLPGAVGQGGETVGKEKTANEPWPEKRRGAGIKSAHPLRPFAQGGFIVWSAAE